ncbi:MAG: 50S ribosomal protein L35 [Gammaproteobacteria bacterium]|nr:50S ribosomal protein L35 [Gammaproteobacteria bacterium]
MPKIKTNRGAAKRFKKTGAGHYKHKQSHLRHLLSSKTSKRKRQLGPHPVLKHADEKMIRELIPYK